mmetsp:Transcript_9673/g.12188  ORF Transcript_9673/g.12188 Transcript_9673/m.12188 type:complete len:264 (+) Transcript_9673:123-914(+)
MADDKLRSVMVYRIEAQLGASPSVILLANYDFMTDYEAHAGATTEGTLYDGRGKGYSDAVGLVVSNDPPGTGGESETIGGFKVVQSDAHQVVYGGDSDGLCISVVTGLRYPSRVATQMLTELYAEYKQTFGEEAKTAEEKTLTRKSKSILSKFCKKYAVLQSVDKASMLVQKVDSVKSQMQDNIATMLSNMEKSESISSQAEQLNEQASVFKKKGKELKKQMRCKNLKMTIILSVLIIAILLIILVPLIRKATANAGGNNGGN